MIYVLIILSGFNGSHYKYTAAPVFETEQACETTGEAITSSNDFTCIQVTK